MQNHILLLLLYCLAVTTLSAQEKKNKTKYGKITPEEINMNSYAEDLSANAVILYDKGEYDHIYSMSNQRFNFSFERHVRIKIFKKEAFHLADLRLLLYGDQKLTDLKAKTYNMENGQIVETELKDENVFIEKLGKDLTVEKVTIPGIKEGTIFEYSYTVKDSGLPDWTFQNLQYPTVWSEFKASIPAFVEFSKESHGWVPFLVAEEKERTQTIGTNISYSATSLHYIQEKVPALKPEPYVLSPADYLSQINFDVRGIYTVNVVEIGATLHANRGALIETNDNWTELSKKLLEDVYQKPMKGCHAMTSDLAQVAASGNSHVERITAVYEYVGKNYLRQDQNMLWLTDNIENIVKNRKGSPTDLNLVLIGMLRKAGFKAWPLAISTLHHGRVLPYRVSADAFDRIIVAVENTDSSFLMLDASAWPHPLGLLPEEDLNEAGLLLREPSGGDWLPLKNQVATRSALHGNFTLLTDGTVSGSLIHTESGYEAVLSRASMLASDPQKFHEKRWHEMLGEVKITKCTVDNLKSWQEPNIKSVIELEAPNIATVSGNKIYFTPTLGLGMKANPFKNPERKFNVELGVPKSYMYTFILKMPEGYAVEELPKSAKLAFGENQILFEYYSEQTDNTLKFTIRHQIKQPLISVEFYPDLQKFYGDILSKFEEQVVLTKM